MTCWTVSFIFLTSYVLVGTIAELTLCPFVVSVDGAGYQLSDLCLHSTMDASQVRDGPFSFQGAGWIFKICA